MQLHENDNVAVVLTGPLAGHKIATQVIASGEVVRKYGWPIAVATVNIAPGEHVHSHNVVDPSLVDQANWDSEATASGWAVQEPDNDAAMRHRRGADPTAFNTFRGYIREDGRVGTRNDVLIASRVNCSATVCHEIARRFPAERLAEFPHVDALAIATHTTGCAMRYAGLKQTMLGRVLRGYATHANVGGCLMIGLGCEQTTPEYLSQHHDLVQIQGPHETPTPPAATRSLTMQASGGTRATIDQGEKQVEALLDAANQYHRQTVDARHLKLGLECGGSDGYSGMTANPLVGLIADRVIAAGGAAVISETTELVGAEHLLYRRAVDAHVAAKLREKIQWWHEHVGMYGGQIDNNPSVGNKAGGLTTITEKSLGAVAKSGHSPLVDVVDYGCPIPEYGLSVMDSPGFDPASVTGKVAGGCNLVLFTTGRGSCFGCKPVPVVKIASNSLMAQAMAEDIDFDAGEIILDGDWDSLSNRLWEQIIEHASGRPTASERQGLGDHEFVPWTVGPTL